MNYTLTFSETTMILAKINEKKNKSIEKTS